MLASAAPVSVLSCHKVTVAGRSTGPYVLRYRPGAYSGVQGYQPVHGPDEGAVWLSHTTAPDAQLAWMTAS